MKRRLFLAAFAAAALAASASAQTAPAAPGAVRVALDTADGPILVEVYPDKAPITAGNFLRYVDEKRFDGATFYRASKVPNAPEYGLVQGGVQNDPKRVLRPIAHEPTTKTGLSHVDGALSMGRTAPGTATSDFFICVGDMPYMDADPKQPGDNLGFAVFGKVIEGMDTVRTILAEPTSPTAGEGVMKGEILAKPVKIVTARRISS
ncbi:peptidylprolyl isomerase [Phenylobacterium sp.]|uniref:peptidylprolyl isomerase n=1 Tax=Phenylobacterium sp. TaxID=1871053 RepID=UPI0035B09360